MKNEVSNREGKMSYRNSCLIAVCTLLILFIRSAPAGAEITDTMKCESLNHARTECRAKQKIRKVVLKVQLSKAKCIRYKTYGIAIKGYSMWVSGGCRGTFTVRSGSSPALF